MRSRSRFNLGILLTSHMEEIWPQIDYQDSIKIMKYLMERKK